MRRLLGVALLFVFNFMKTLLNSVPVFVVVMVVIAIIFFVTAFFKG
jgi:hypothetical protein